MFESKVVCTRCKVVIQPSIIRRVACWLTKASTMIVNFIHSAVFCDEIKPQVKQQRGLSEWSGQVQGEIRV